MIRHWIAIFFLSGIGFFVAGAYVLWGAGFMLLAAAASFFMLAVLLGAGMRENG